MIEEPNCRKRSCRHFDGVTQDNQDEMTERVVCAAFPEGIPEIIAYGENLHLGSFHGDRGIQYEKDD